MEGNQVLDAVSSLAQVVAQTLAIYLFLIVVLGLAGRRQVAQLTMIEFVIVALLGSAVETGLYAGSSSLAAGLTSAITLLVANRCMAYLMTHSSRLRRAIIGHPVVLVHDGQIVRSHLRSTQLTENNLMAAIRLRGYDSVEEIRFAILEPDGSIGVVPNDKAGGNSQAA